MTLLPGEVGLNAVDGRAPAAANGEISSTPAGGCELSVAVAAPAGSPVSVAVCTELNVMTIRP